MDEWVYAALKLELESAKKRHQEARERFWKIVGKPRELLPRAKAGVPHPDGSQMVRNAAAQETHARKEHLEPLIRMNEYLIRGTIPEHLQKKTRSAGGYDS